MPPSGSKKAPNWPIFLHSGFRSSSTWLWTKFRSNDQLLCYYEPLNEQFASLTLENIEDARPDGWRSRHPQSAPYALEYAGLLGKNPGVPNFPKSEGLGDRYIGSAGAEGPLDGDIAAYLKGLIDYAAGQDRVPLLSCTRLLGRVSGLREAFGGYHILLIRNLFQQWNSYAGQARFGNWYFVRTLYETLELEDRDPVVSGLADIFPPDTRTTFEAWVSADNFDKVFCYFIGFHLYFLTIARRHVDLVIDANALASGDSAHTEHVTAEVQKHLGIQIDLRDAREQVDFPLRPIGDRASCATQIESMSTNIKLQCNATPDEKDFIDGLLAALWSEQDKFQRQTSAAFEYCDLISQKSNQLQTASSDRINALSLELQDVRTALEAHEFNFGNFQNDTTREKNGLLEQLSSRDAKIETLENLLNAEREERERYQVEIDVQLKQHANEYAEAQRNIHAANCTINDMTMALAEVHQKLEIERDRTERFSATMMMLEGAISNVGAANLELSGRVQKLTQSEAESASLLAKEKAAREQAEALLQQAREDPEGRRRLAMLLDIVLTQSRFPSFMPTQVWRRRFYRKLAALPGLNTGFDPERDELTPTELSDILWTAIVRR